MIAKSESIANIAAALTKFQGAVKNPPKTGVNPHYNSRYTTLDGIVDAVKGLLADNGLSYIQSCSGDGERITVTTLLMHSSGEWIECEPLVLKAERVTPQGAGSAITYGRRYALAAALGIASDEDDDGNAAEGADKSDSKSGNKGGSKGNKAPLSSEQLSQLMAALEAAGKDTELVCKAERVTSVEALSIEQYNKWMKICSKSR